MKAITLRQPFASLVAINVKTIETRSWNPRYRGPLAIHAGKAKPPRDGLGMVGDYWTEFWSLDGPGDTGWQLMGPVQGPGCPHAPLPLGAVIATCTLVDVVPIVALNDPTPGGQTYLCSNMPEPDGGMWPIGPGPFTHGFPLGVEGQRPYGDYSPGRFAWLLEDIQPLPVPVPATGKQGFWEWKR